MFDPYGHDRWRRPLCAMTAIALMACFQPLELPPRAPPARVLPSIAIEPGPTAPGTARIAFDSTDGPIKVEEVLSNSTAEAFAGRGYGFASVQTTRPICTAPCIADLPYGSHEITFLSRQRDDSYLATVVAGTKPSVYRVAPALRKPATGTGFLIESLGLGAILLGTTLIGVASSSHHDHDEHSDEHRTQGAVLALAGGVVTTIGLSIDFAGRGSFQPGNGVQWTPSDGAIYRKTE